MKSEKLIVFRAKVSKTQLKFKKNAESIAKKTEYLLLLMNPLRKLTPAERHMSVSCPRKEPLPTPLLKERA